MMRVLFVIIIHSLILGACGLINSSVQVLPSTGQLEWTSKSDFLKGTLATDLEYNSTPGQLSLKVNRSQYQLTDKLLQGGDLTLSEVPFYLNPQNNLQLSNDHIISPSTVTGIPGKRVFRMKYVQSSGVLYVSYPDQDVVCAIDTKHTVTISDDTVLGTYHSGSTPAVSGAGWAKQMYYIESSGFLYIPTSAGVSVIDTKKTNTLADDTLVINYSTASTPALPGNNVQSVDIDEDNNIIYLAIRNFGIVSIATQGTDTTADDIIVMIYNMGTTPALTTTRPRSVVVGEDGLIYPHTWWQPIQIFDTNLTPTNPTDDTNVGGYSTISTIATAEDYPFIIHVDRESHLLTITAGEYVHTINTNGTRSLADDVLVGTYDSTFLTSTPSFPVATKYGNYLILAAEGRGLYVVDQKGTVTQADDELVGFKDFGGTGEIVSGTIWSLEVDKASGALFVGISGVGLQVIDLNKYISSSSSGEDTTSTYVSPPLSLSGFNYDHFRIDLADSENSNIQVQFRTGGATAAYRDDFDDNVVPTLNLLWGAALPTTISESGGELHLGGTAPSGWYAFETPITGVANQYKTGSLINLKIKYTTANVRDLLDFLFVDGFEGQSTSIAPSGKWALVSFKTDTDFSSIGLEPWWTGTWGVGDQIDIDWLTVSQPDSEWDAWGASCTNPFGCPIDVALGGKSWIQFKLTVQTTAGVSPAIKEANYSKGYAASGIYITDNQSFRSQQTLENIELEMDEPDGTSISVEYSTDAGTTWASIAAPYEFSNVTAKQIQLKFTFQTTNETLTPTLKGVKFNSKNTTVLVNNPR